MNPPCLRKFLIISLLILSSVCAFATADYSPYEGDSIRKGTGGTKKVVDGIDIWNNGTPPRTYKILGILEDQRGTGFLSNMRYYPSLAEQAKKVGGDAVIILNSDTETKGAYVDGGDVTIVKRKTTKTYVIKYQK